MTAVGGKRRRVEPTMRSLVISGTRTECSVDFLGEDIYSCVDTGIIPLKLNGVDRGESVIGDIVWTDRIGSKMKVSAESPGDGWYAAALYFGGIEGTSECQVLLLGST